MRWFRSIDVSGETSGAEVWSDAARRGFLTGLIFGVVVALGSGPARGIVAGVLFGAFMTAYLGWDLLRHRARARATPSGRVNHRPRPSYMPARWQDRDADHWAMRTPLRALVYWAVPGVLAAVALFLRIAFPDWFASDDGTPDGTIVIAAPVVLGASWVFGLRAWREYRSKQR